MNKQFTESIQPMNCNFIKQSIRNVVGNLEDVLGNLQGVVGDLRVLVHHIENVTNKLDKRFGTVWRSIDDNANNSPVMNGTKEHSITVALKKENLDSYESMKYSSDFDWAFITMSQYSDCLSVCSSDVPATYIENEKLHACANVEEEEVSDESLMSMASTDGSVDGNSLLTSITCSESTKSPSSDLSLAMSDANTFRTCCQDEACSAKQDSYCGIYEALMESHLETISNFCESFDNSECDEFDATSASEYKANYNRDVNPWTSFSVMHVDSIAGSDDYVSETVSDILNDNTLDSSAFETILTGTVLI